MPSSFSSFLIGSDTLLIECCQRLKESGNEVLGIITSESRISDWAIKNGFRWIPEDDYLSVLKSEECDYLFAITYLKLIPDNVLDLPRRATINFHDGPLPKYAGLNTPAWALINNEEQYGVSWHLVSPGVDEGDILKQKIFDIATDETSLTLNAKCFEHAIESFSELIDELYHESSSATAQDLSERSYFGRYDRPQAACVIDWNQSAKVVDGLIRAMDFGGYPNPLGSPKIQIGSRWYIAAACTIIEENDDGSDEVVPGTVLGVYATGISVACGVGSINLTSLLTLDGLPVEFEKIDGANQGEALHLCSQDELSGFTQRVGLVVKAEAFWSKRISEVDVVEAPFSDLSAAKPVEFDRVKVDIENDVESEALFGYFAILIARLSRMSAFDIGLIVDNDDLKGAMDRNIFATQVPFRVGLESDSLASDYFPEFSKNLKRTQGKGTFLLDLVARTPELRTGSPAVNGYPVAISLVDIGTLQDGTVLCMLVDNSEKGAVSLLFDSSRLERANVERIGQYLNELMASIQRDEKVPLSEQKFIPTNEVNLIVDGFNDTAQAVESVVCIHQQFEKQVELNPYATAVIFRTEVINYLNLNARANQLAHHLISQGVTPDTLVGVYIDRSLDMMVSILAVLKSGGAFVPMDPEFPANRLAYIFENSGASILLTQNHLSESAPVSQDAVVIRVDADWKEIADQPASNPVTDVNADNLAYVIYTSGSTGKPKGVMIEHKNVCNFFAGMDTCIKHDKLGSWLALTSLSFDISILELFWTLNRGIRLVLFKDNEMGGELVSQDIRRKKIDFDLFLWGSDGSQGGDKYRQMLEASKFADKNGFKAVWTPERHFNNWGGPYPNPCVTSAAIAAVTENIQIRAGSCVIPLHHPIRVAEDWSIVDNISQGRVGIAAASGWQPKDFVIRPEGFENNREVLFSSLEKIQQLWHGESVEFEGVDGEMVNVVTQPRPIQESLPVWITSAGNVDTFRKAGLTGANLLTHLLGQSVEQVAEKIAAYRAARAEAGYDPATGIVTVMLHTLVGSDTASVRELVQEPLKDYLRGSISLLADNIWAFPTFRRPGDTSSSLEGIDIDRLSSEDVEAIVDFSFERYFNQSGLFGTPERCMAMVNRLKSIDVDEIGCLIDYGIDTEVVLESLKLLTELKDKANTDAESGDEEFGFASQIEQHNVTHFQCTPSMARMLFMEEDNRTAMLKIQNIMIGGESLPLDLANSITDTHKGSLTNMYGPTETTIWSSTHQMDPQATSIPIGKPIANTQMYILDQNLQILPVGITGNLYIGGRGVARGYKDLDELTNECFVPNPFKPGERIYNTGDLARVSEQGVFEYLGRSDFQVKIRGFRIELGEIESCLLDSNTVNDCVVVVEEFSAGDQRLVAYIVSDVEPLDEELLRNHLRCSVPDYMVPGHYALLDRIPQTPNGKIDRNALPRFSDTRAVTRELVEPGSDLESRLLEIWSGELALNNISVDEAFFDIGGNSLLLVAVHRRVRAMVEKKVTLTDLYRFPTIRTLAQFLSGEGGLVVTASGSKRAQARKERQQRRRGRTKKT